MYKNLLYINRKKIRTDQPASKPATHLAVELHPQSPTSSGRKMENPLLLASRFAFRYLLSESTNCMAPSSLRVDMQL